VPDSALLSEIFRGYNDWLAEFCTGEPKRLKGIAMINVDDVQEGVEELERCAKMGLAGGMVTVYPPEGKGYDNPMYDTVEHELSWIPHFLNRIDYTYTQRVQQERYRFEEAMLPSDYFRRNVFAGFQEDAMGIRDRHIIGVDNLLWGSDYPHVESTFPRSRQIIEEVLMDCTEEEKAKIAGGNAARIYHLT
jgi:predicted TIM-barrel fold metal-dependent hydrolase